MGGPSVLVVAAWGYPPAWRKARYTVTINHPAFKDAKPVECTTCSTTLALLSFLLQNGYNAKALIFGLDTAATPRQGEDGATFRSRVEELYKSWFKQLSGDADCHIDVPDYQVKALPGLGIYGGWRFRGTPMALFNAAVDAILDALETRNFIIVDLSHGVNYQTVAVLYATVTAAVIRGLEDRLLIYNSDPYPQSVQSQPCVPSDKNPPTQYIPSLKLNDVSELQRAVRRIRQVAMLRRFQIPEWEKPDKKEMSQQTHEAEEILRQLLKYICAISNGAAALCFRGAKYGDGTSPLPLPELEQPEKPNTIPIIKDGEVTYPPVSPAYVIEIATSHVIKDLKKLQASDLSTFLKNIAKKYKEFGMVLNYLILHQTAKEIDDITYCVSMMYKTDDSVILNSKEACTLAECYKTRRKEAAQRHSPSEEQEPCEGKIEDICKDASKICEKTIQERNAIKDKVEKGKIELKHLRNLLAHGGFSYVYINHIKLHREADGEYKITEVIYDKETLDPFLKKLFDICKIP